MLSNVKLKSSAQSIYPMLTWKQKMMHLLQAESANVLPGRCAIYFSAFLPPAPFWDPWVPWVLRLRFLRRLWRWGWSIAPAVIPRRRINNPPPPSTVYYTIAGENSQHRPQEPSRSPGHKWFKPNTLLVTELTMETEWISHDYTQRFHTQPQFSQMSAPTRIHDNHQKPNYAKHEFHKKLKPTRDSMRLSFNKKPTKIHRSKPCRNLYMNIIGMVNIIVASLLT